MCSSEERERDVDGTVGIAAIVKPKLEMYTAWVAAGARVSTTRSEDRQWKTFEGRSELCEDSKVPPGYLMYFWRSLRLGFQFRVEFGKTLDVVVGAPSSVAWELTESATLSMYCTR